MPARTIDVQALGNAIVDVLAQTDEGFLVARKLHKGAMQLIDEPRPRSSTARWGPATVISGGSAANTVGGRRFVRLRAAFIGKVRDDELGRIYTHDLRALASPSRFRRRRTAPRRRAASFW